MDTEPCWICEGNGWYVVEGHAPDCDCGTDEPTTCPIPMQEQCENCRGTGEVLRVPQQ